MPTPKKEQEVLELAERIRRAQGLYLTDFTGLTVEQMNDLRSRLRKEKVQYRIAKNTLMKLAFTQAGYPGLLDGYLEGPTGYAFGFDDPVLPARLLVQFAREKQKLQLKASFVSGQVYDATETERLAGLPSRPELLAQVVGQLNAPIAGLVWTLNGLIIKLVHALRAIKEKKEAA